MVFVFERGGGWGRAITMADCNRNYIFNKVQPFTVLPFIWLSNLKFVGRRKSNVFF